MKSRWRHPKKSMGWYRDTPRASPPSLTTDTALGPPPLPRHRDAGKGAAPMRPLISEDPDVSSWTSSFAVTQPARAWIAATW